MQTSKIRNWLAGFFPVLLFVVTVIISGCDSIPPVDKNPVFAKAELTTDFAEKLFIVVSVEESLTEGFEVKRVILRDSLDNSLISALTTNQEVWMDQKVQVTQLNYTMINDGAASSARVAREVTVYVLK